VSSPAADAKLDSRQPRLHCAQRPNSPFKRAMAGGFSTPRCLGRCGECEGETGERVGSVGLEEGSTRTPSCCDADVACLTSIGAAARPRRLSPGRLRLTRQRPTNSPADSAQHWPQPSTLDSGTSMQPIL
jgi:hypothetical protein